MLYFLIVAALAFLIVAFVTGYDHTAAGWVPNDNSALAGESLGSCLDGPLSQ